MILICVQHESSMKMKNQFEMLPSSDEADSVVES